MGEASSETQSQSGSRAARCPDPLQRMPHQPARGFFPRRHPVFDRADHDAGELSRLLWRWERRRSKKNASPAMAPPATAKATPPICSIRVRATSRPASSASSPPGTACRPTRICFARSRAACRDRPCRRGRICLKRRVGARPLRQVVREAPAQGQREPRRLTSSAAAAPARSTMPPEPPYDESGAGARARAVREGLRAVPRRHRARRRRTEADRLEGLPDASARSDARRVQGQPRSRPGLPPHRRRPARDRRCRRAAICRATTRGISCTSSDRSRATRSARKSR